MAAVAVVMLGYASVAVAADVVGGFSVGVAGKAGMFSGCNSENLVEDAACVGLHYPCRQSWFYWIDMGCLGVVGHW